MKLQTKFNQLMDQLNNHFVEREEIVKLITLAVLTNNNVLLVGLPGTAKTAIAEMFSKSFADDVHFFSYLLTKFTTPEEIFGPFSINKLKEDKFERILDGKICKSHIAFLDEVFKCNSGMLNSLLTVMNERIFYNGEHKIHTPLLTVIGATNELPENDLFPFLDRFVLKAKVEPVLDISNWIKMIETEEVKSIEKILTIQDIKEAQKEIQLINLSMDIIYKMYNIKQKLSQEGIFVTDRTAVKSKEILKAIAWLSGRQEVHENDLEILRYIYWNKLSEYLPVYNIILTLTNPTKHNIIKIYENAKTMYEKLKQLQSNKDANLYTEAAQILQNLKNAKQQIEEQIKLVQNSTTEDLEKLTFYLNKTNILILEINKSIFGIQTTGI